MISMFIAVKGSLSVGVFLCPGRAGGTKQLWPFRAGVGTRTGPVGRGSRIPSLTPGARRNAAGKQ